MKRRHTKRRRLSFPRRRWLLLWIAVLVWASPDALVVVAGVVVALGALAAVVWPGQRAGSYYTQVFLAILGIDTFVVVMLALGVFLT